MARYLEIAEEAMREIRARRLQKKAAALSKLFCSDCGTHFDTSVGIARHQAYGCEKVAVRTKPAELRTKSPEPPRSMPSCPKCGSFALYPVAGGAECQTCGTLFTP
jgi:hypothetical protein